LNALHGTIASRRLTDVAEIGAIRADTNFGSCILQLKAILSALRRDEPYPLEICEPSGDA